MRFRGFSFRIGTFFRTRLRVHYTWLLAFILIPWAVSTQYSNEMDLNRRVLLGLVTAGMFFVAVFLREILLLIIARHKNTRVSLVTIFPFGGLVQADYEPDSPSHEMLLAVSGMLANFAITAIFYFSALFADAETFLLYIPLKWLAFFYLTLSLFHLVPAYPLEGGRMIHVLLWKITKDIRLATRISGISGWVLGLVTIAGGLVLALFTEELFTGLFFIALGLIIQNAATHGMRQIKLIPLPDNPPDMPDEPPAGERVIGEMRETPAAINVPDDDDTGENVYLGPSQFSI